MSRWTKKIINDYVNELPGGGPVSTADKILINRNGENFAGSVNNILSRIDNLEAQFTFEVISGSYDVVNNIPDISTTPLAPKKAMRIGGTFAEPFSRFGFTWLPGDIIMRLEDDYGYNKSDNTTEINDTIISTKLTYSSQKTENIKTTLEAQILDEANTRQAADVNLTTSLNTETADRITADSSLQNQINLKANSADVYSKIESYSQSQVDSLLSTNATNDRNRANHTGAQLASTISDFQTQVSANTDVINSKNNKNIKS